MSKNDDGGSAFPTHASGYVDEPRDSGAKNLGFELSGGMSLRDWFAGQALAGLLVMVRLPSIDKLTDFESGSAEAAYRLADAMLKARDK